MSTPSAVLPEERLELAASTARDLLGHAGVSRWEVYTKASVIREVAVGLDGTSETIHSEEAGVAVRTWHQGRAGFATASGPLATAARRATGTATTTATEVPLDPLPPARVLATAAVDEPCNLPPQGWAAHAADALHGALSSASDGRLQLLRTVLQVGVYRWLLTTAEEFVASHVGTSSALLAEVAASDQSLGVWREWVHVPDPANFDAHATANQICNRALLTRAPTTADRGLKDVILDGEVTAHLMAALAPLLVATPPDEDPLPKLLDRDGCLASRCLGLVDDRLSDDVPLRGPCDGEGLPARRTLLVEEGVPRHRLASWRDARLYDEAPRGGAVRLSYRTYPVSGIANLRVVTDQAQPPAELLDQTDRALYLLRPVARPDLDFSADSYRLVSSGVWLAGGRVRGWHPTVELHGALGALLRRVAGVGSDARWYQTDRGFVAAPTLLVRRQPVVG